MTALLDQAIEEVKRLAPAEQDDIARELLDMLASERRWDALFADPRSEAALARLVAKTREEIAKGDVYDFDPATRPKT